MTMNRGAKRRERRGGRLVRPGFSLLELMLVLVIIGVLTALAAWNLVGTGNRAKIRATKASLSQIQSMLKTYYLEQNTYPPDIATLVSAKYLEAKRDKDGFNRAFYYQLRTGNEERPFDLISAGPDGSLGTTDDIDVWTMETQ